MSSKQTGPMAALCAGGFVLVNVAFYLLSMSYFDSPHGTEALATPEHIMQVRIDFAVFSGVVAVASFAAGLWPARLGHLLAWIFGLADLAGAIAAFKHHAPAVLGMTLLLAGILFPTLAWFSARGKRAPWAFLVAMCGVFAVVEIFGAPKVRNALDVGLWRVMTAPGLKVVAMLALISVRGDYGAEHEPELATASIS